MHVENYKRTQLVRCIEQYNKNSTMRSTNGTIGSDGTPINVQGFWLPLVKMLLIIPLLNRANFTIMRRY